MRDVENAMVVDSYWHYLEKDSGLENVVSQPECCGVDFYGSEIIEGDQIAIDHDNFDEIILKEHLKRYCIEQLKLVFRGGLVIDKNLFRVFEERHLEQHLHERYNFEFRTAD